MWRQIGRSQWTRQIEHIGCTEEQLGRVQIALDERAKAQEMALDESLAGRITLKDAARGGAQVQEAFSDNLRGILTPDEFAKVDEGGAKAEAIHEMNREPPSTDDHGIGRE